MALTGVFHEAAISFLFHLIFLSAKQHARAQDQCNNLSIATDNSAICDFTMFKLPQYMLKIGPEKRENLDRKCIKLALNCHQPVNTLDFVSCTDLTKTFNLSLYPQFLDNPYVPLDPDNPVNETMLTVCYESYLNVACTVRIYRSNDNTFQLFADVNFREKPWQRPDPGCDCSRFKRLYAARETAPCRKAQEVPRTLVTLALLNNAWAGYLVVILCVSLMGLCKYVRSNK